MKHVIKMSWDLGIYDDYEKYCFEIKACSYEFWFLGIWEES